MSRILTQLICFFIAAMFCACTHESTNSPILDDSYYSVKYVYEPEIRNTVSTKIEYTNEYGQFIEEHGGRSPKSFCVGPVKKGYTAKIRFSIPYSYIHIVCSIEISENGGPYIRKASTGSKTSKGSASYTIR